MRNALCENCKEKEGRRNACEGDGRFHHHGRVHTLGGGLKWLCGTCADIEKTAWQYRKKGLPAIDSDHNIYI